MTILQLLSKNSNVQWSCWQTVRALATVSNPNPRSDAAVLLLPSAAVAAAPCILHEPTFYATRYFFKRLVCEVFHHALQHVVVSAEAAQAVAQQGRGLVQLPHDMVQTLDGYFKGQQQQQQQRQPQCYSIAAAA
jgi:hypothetical protein